MIQQLRVPLRRIRSAGLPLAVSLSFVGGVALMGAGIVAAPDYGRGSAGDETAALTCPPKAVSHNRPADGSLVLAGLLDEPTCDDGGCSGCTGTTSTTTTSTTQPSTTTTTEEDDDGCTGCDGGATTTTQPQGETTPTTEPSDSGCTGCGSSGDGGTGSDGSGSGGSSDGSSGGSSDGSSGAQDDDDRSGGSDSNGDSDDSETSGAAGHSANLGGAGEGSRSAAGSGDVASEDGDVALATRAREAEHVAIRGIPGTPVQLDADQLRRVILVWAILHALAAVALGYRHSVRLAVVPARRDRDDS